MNPGRKRAGAAASKARQKPLRPPPPRRLAPPPAQPRRPASPPRRAFEHRRQVSPTLLFTGVAGVVAGAVAAAGVALGWPRLAAALAGVNVATFVLYAYDKAVAGRGRLRVPERVLHLGALAGGTLAAFLGMRLLRHKTSKPEFLRHYAAIVVLQVAAVVALVLFARA